MRRSLASQGFEEAAAAAILRRAERAAGGGQSPGVGQGAPGACLFLILDDEVGELADRAGAKAQQYVRRIVGEALEIAAQAAFAGGAGHGVFGQGEMVEADGFIASAGRRFMTLRSEERRVGKELCITCRSRGSP